MPLTPAALARAVVTMTEGKSAALHRLAVPSRCIVDLATGTGTDQYCVAAPGAPAVGADVGEPAHEAGRADRPARARDATMEALRWQNGLEASYTRGVFHALGRYGVKEATLLRRHRAAADRADLELLRKNTKAVFYEPLVGAAAHALPTVLDRVGTARFPQRSQRDAMVQQAAALAANLAAQVGSLGGVPRQPAAAARRLTI